MSSIIFTPRLNRAITVAGQAHRFQKRKSSGIPYICHPFAVMVIASQTTSDEDILIACLFHDILEDVPEEFGLEAMAEEFGSEVVEIVQGVTKNDRLGDWWKVSEGYFKTLESASDKTLVVCLAD